MTAALLDKANEEIRQAVEQRLEAQAAGKPHSEWYGGETAEVSQQSPRGWSAADVIERFAAPEPRTFYGGESATTRAEQTLHDAIAAVRDRHGKYGPPQEHFGRTAALVNAAFGTSFTPADWALVMVLDKIARQVGPGRETDDAAVDIAGYAACHQECRKH